MSDNTPPLTILLNDTLSPDDRINQLLPLVYAQLRAAAAVALAGESPAHTLQPTALVHEAYMRLAGPREIPWQNRAHFYAAAAEAMRRILIDHARAKQARGGRPVGSGEHRANEIPDVASLASSDPEQILAVDRALARLEVEDPESAAIVKLRFFAGLSVEHAAETMGISPRSAARQWTFARARLHRLLSEGDGGA
ncbi:MAG: sigma-70 family RNA polymerase sigma factor [Phycisphaeraceae bacterium]|nr:sigma-70 family RNA polymerase sigma factor [Phycisphaeraceae bacterium]MBX3367615.1 sigma-70 family RNA polymerase sigma factor [Phycisphaeraceae bacterium]QYK47704.1 MAG: sigma-70 family RNA polymerase sigma factor [Phycisphaeraceae bacterium]